MNSLKMAFVKDSVEDIMNAKFIPFSYKIWAFMNGFNPSVAWFKKINKNNKSDFLKDSVYWGGLPIIIQSISK